MKITVKNTYIVPEDISAFNLGKGLEIDCDTSNGVVELTLSKRQYPTVLIRDVSGSNSKGEIVVNAPKGYTIKGDEMIQFDGSEESLQITPEDYEKVSSTSSGDSMDLVAVMENTRELLEKGFTLPEIFEAITKELE